MESLSGRVPTAGVDPLQTFSVSAFGDRLVAGDYLKSVEAAAP